MADGLFNLCGRRVVELSKDGRTYKLAVRTLDDYAAKEAAIVQRVGNPWHGIETIKDPAIRSAAMKIAADIAARPLIATFEDENKFDQSFRGVGWSIWKALSVHHPVEFPPTADTATAIQLGCDFIAWFGDVSRIIAALHKVEEKDILGNSKAQAEAG